MNQIIGLGCEKVNGKHLLGRVKQVTIADVTYTCFHVQIIVVSHSSPESLWTLLKKTCPQWFYRDIREWHTHVLGGLRVSYPPWNWALNMPLVINGDTVWRTLVLFALRFRSIPGWSFLFILFAILSSSACKQISAIFTGMFYVLATKISTFLKVQTVIRVLKCN